MRALCSELHRLRPNWPDLDIYEPAPAGPLSDRLAAEAPGYVSSQYREEGVDEAVFEQVRNEDLRALTFDDASLDLVITQDVLEHVFQPDRVFAEIHRVLRPGGLHLFTVPIYPDPTLQRARLNADGEVEHLEEPDYHGNPVAPGGSLVVHEWGMDLAARIDRAAPTFTLLAPRPSWRRGVAGEFLHVGVTAPAGVDTRSRRERVTRAARASVTRTPSIPRSSAPRSSAPRSSTSPSATSPATAPQGAHG